MSALQRGSRQPKLRFPEFEGDWKFGTIRQFLRKVSKPVAVEADEQYRQIGVRSHGKGLFHKEAVSGSELGEKRVFWVEPNTLVLNIVFAWEQALALTTENERGFVASHRFPMFASVKGESYLPFMLHFFMRKRGKSLLALASPGGAGRNKTLGQDEFAKLKVFLPDTKEQMKIASFLEVVDEKVSALKRKHKLLKEYKRGVMQKIFSRDIRFKREDGSAFPDWETKKIGLMYGFVPTNSLSREMLSYEVGTIQNIHYGDIHTRFRSQFYQDKELIPFIRASGAPSKFDDESYCRVGDLIIADASEDYADIGKAIEIIDVRPKSLVAGLHTLIARPKSEQIAVGYSGYLFQTHAMRRQLMRIAQGISVMGISKGNLNKLDMPLPHPDEQKKIVDFLRVIDTKIDEVIEYISGMANYKAGLLQRLFV